jgi:GNAT superfamily N-acetyltransferase
MLIRRMRECDIKLVVELTLLNYDGVLAGHHSADVIAGLRAEVTPESLREQMAWKQVFVVEDAGEVVATGALADFGTPEAGMYTVSQFYVRPDLHGRGIGERLLAHIVRTALDAGASRLHVPSSRNAIPFYRRAGFVVDATQPDTAIEITWMSMPLREGPAEQAASADAPRSM